MSGVERRTLLPVVQAASGSVDRPEPLSENSDARDVSTGADGNPILRDSFGRTARDLRISLTDRCNLRCTYCMPAEGLDWLPTEQTLSDDEVVRLARIAVEILGIDEIRFTGGEPLLRRSLEQIIRRCSSLNTRHGFAPEISLTTNGLGLDKRADSLKEAGLTRVNVSLDTLDPERYAKLARRDRFHDVVKGLEGAKAAGLGPIKINTVLMHGVNEDDAVPLLRFCLKNGYHLRFIEQMPLGPPHTWHRAEMVNADEIRRRLGEVFELSSEPVPQGSAPAAVWQVAEGADHPAGTVGIIASVSHPFCGACDRTRLTADGQMRTCLFSRSETDLRGPMRAGASDQEIAEIWAGAQAQKKAGHDIDDESFIQPGRTMSAIGG